MMQSSFSTCGIPLQEARDYIAVGCDEISVHGHWARCNGGYINLPKVLELTLGNGTDPKSGVSMFHPCRAEIFSAIDESLLQLFPTGDRPTG